MVTTFERWQPMEETAQPIPKPVGSILGDAAALLKALSESHTRTMDEFGARLISGPADVRAAVRDENRDELAEMAELRDRCAIMKCVAIRVLSSYGVAKPAGSITLAKEIERFAQVWDSAYDGATLAQQSHFTPAQLKGFHESTREEAASFEELKQAAETLAAVSNRMLQIFDAGKDD